VVSFRQDCVKGNFGAGIRIIGELSARLRKG
jgi:hypothetical protein